jgi:hypothetical protein
MLTATIGIIVVTGLVLLAVGIMIATGAKELFRASLEDIAGTSLTDADLEDLAGIAGYDSLDSYLSTYAMRGYLAVAGGVLLVLFGLCMTKAATWARVMVTITAPIAMIFAFIVVGGDSTTTTAALGLVAVLGCVLTIIFTWLPPNGRYAKALKAAR